VEANLKRRVVSAAVVLSMVVFVVGWAKPWIFTALVFGVMALALYEYFAMALPGKPAAQALGVAFGFALAVGHWLPEIVNRELWLALLLIAIFASSLFPYGDLSERLTRLAWTILGAFYIGWLAPHWILLWQLPDGRNWVFFLLLVIIAGDTSAYFVGHRFGVRKLAPRISPTKTIAGAFGYTIGGAAAGALAARFLLNAYSFFEITVLALLLTGLGQLGDLFESLLKRVFAVKDSSTLVPGHGGVLDRIDSLIFPAVFANAYLKVFHS
jgi:phosphatidate cytidylyltransferase